MTSRTRHDPDKNDAGQMPEIPDFILSGVCGAGASGTVWIGTDRDGIRRAVRVLRRDALPPERIDAEKQAVSAYRNLVSGEAGLIEVLYTGETAEALYYVMPLADNRPGERNGYRPDTLAARIGDAAYRRDAKLNDLTGIAAALRKMHDRGLAHRDLKPENILFLAGRPVIADPGSCGPLAEVADAGTPGYQPPVPARGDAADLHAFGKIVYTVFSGYPPERYPDISAKWNDSFAAGIDRIVLRCCESGPESFRDAAELHAELRKLAEREGIRPRRRSFPIAGAVLSAAAVLLILCVGALASLRPPAVQFASGKTPGRSARQTAGRLMSADRGGR